MESLVIAVADPRTTDIRSLLTAHLDFANANSPSEHVHALDLDGLLVPSITFFSARRDGVLVGVGAVKMLDDGHAELKSMHTAFAARGHGVGRALVDHLIAVARARGCSRVSLETGSGPAFAPAHRLYQAAGFSQCEPFAQYTVNSFSVCMTLAVLPT